MDGRADKAPGIFNDQIEFWLLDDNHLNLHSLGADAGFLLLTAFAVTAEELICLLLVVGMVVE